MPKYSVLVPFSGHVVVEVEGADEEDATDEGFMKVEKLIAINGVNNLAEKAVEFEFNLDENDIEAEEISTTN